MPFSAAVLVLDRGGSETSQGCPPGECCGGGQQNWVGLSVHVYTFGQVHGSLSLSTNYLRQS